MIIIIKTQFRGFAILEKNKILDNAYNLFKLKVINESKHALKKLIK